MKQFFEEVAESVRGGHVHSGARLGGLMVLLILIIGAIDQSAGMPRNVYKQTAQATGGACEMNANVTGAGSLGETPASKQQRIACIPKSCWTTAEGGQHCTIKPTAQGMAGGAGGLMDSIGKVLEGLMSGGGGGGGGDTGGYTPPADTTVPPKCTSMVASSGTNPINPKEEVTISWFLSGGTPEEYSYSAGFPSSSAYATSAVVTPERSTTYSLTIKNKAGSSTCSARVYVGPGGYSDIDETDGTETGDTTSTANTNTDDATALADPLTGDTATTNNKNTSASSYSDTATNRAATQTNLGYVASRGVKTNIVADDKAFIEDGKAFVEDKNALKEDKNAFIIEDLTSDADFDALAKELGSDGLYSKEDIATLERLAREAEARKNARVRTALQGVNQLTPSEVQGLWNRPGEARTGSLTENIYDESSVTPSQHRQDTGLVNRFGGWLKRTFCFWCSVESVSIDAFDATQPASSILALNDGVLCVGTGCGSTPAPAPAATAAPKQNKLPTPQLIDAECQEKTKKLQADVCKPKSWSKEQCTGPGKLKPEYEYVPLEKNKLPGNGMLPAAPSSKPAPGPLGAAAAAATGSTSVPKTTTPPPKESTCMQRKDIEKMATGCGKCQKGVSIFATETLSGVTACGSGTTNGDPLKYVCRAETQQQGKDSKGNTCSTPGTGDCKADPSAGAGGANTGGGNNSGGGGSDSGGGGAGQGSGGLADTKMGQGMGEGLGKSLGDMLKGGGGSGSGGSGSGQTPPWWEQDRPTEAPKCVEDTEPEPAQIITRGETATLSWTVTGKGTIKMIVNYVTKDDANNALTGTLGVVDGGMAEVSPDFSTIYKLKATNEIGTVTCKPIKVIVKPPVEDDATIDPVKGEVDLVCDPGSIQKNDPAAIVWSCPNSATSSLGTSTEDGSFSTNGRTEGSYEAKPLRDATYVVRCRDKFDKEVGRNSCTVTVTDSADGTDDAPISSVRPKVQITAEPSSAPQGSSVTIRWKSQDTAACVVYGPGCDTYGKDSDKCFKEVGRSGFVTGNLFETSTFRAECLAPDRKTRTSDSVTVEVIDGGDEVPQQDPLGTIEGE